MDLTPGNTNGDNKTNADLNNRARALMVPETSARVFLTTVALIGILISLLQYILVRQQVSGFLGLQVRQSIVQAVRQTQQRINQAQYLMEAITDIQTVDQAVLSYVMRQILKLTRYDKNATNYVFLVPVANGEVKSGNLILDLAPPASSQASIARLPKVDEDILRVAEYKLPQTKVVSSPYDSRHLWLVLIYPVIGPQEVQQVVVGYVPLQNLFGELFDLIEKGSIIDMTVSGHGKIGDPPFVNIHSSDREFRLLEPYEMWENIFLRDRTWNVVIKAAPREGFTLMALLPMIILGVGLLLTWALIMYLSMTRAKSADVARLATSLHRANDELSRRISDEGRMARALRDSEQKYRAIFENAGIGICQIATSGEWLNANRTAAWILGYESPQDLLLAQPDLHGVLFADSAARSQWFSKLKVESQRDYETVFHTKAGQAIWVNMNGHGVYDGKGDLQYFECTFYDITERRNAERAMRQATQQADFANRSKSEFLANMSHELRTPLNAIIGFSEIIRDQLFGPVGQPQYIEYARDIHDSGGLLLSLINDILDMSKIEAGKRDLSESDIQLADVVRSVVRLVSVRAKAGRIKLNVFVPAELPHLRAEEKALKQILTNLLTNAIKFTQEGGTVSLSAQLTEQGEMAIRVEDTGIGMSPEDIPVALMPFGQIENVLSRKNQGTGLGLPLTKALIELHGGTLNLQSEVGKGTIVTVILPADRIVGRVA